MTAERWARAVEDAKRWEHVRNAAGFALGVVWFTRGGFWRGSAHTSTGSMSMGFPSRDEAVEYVRKHGGRR
jgi:hypothetical protein